MEYLNFEIRIGSAQGEEYPVAVIHSPVGEMSATMRLPADHPAFNARLNAIEPARGEENTHRSIGPPIQDYSNPIFSIEALGKQLFEALFSAKLEVCFRSSLNQARSDKKGLRILLRLEAPELAVIPWEFLYDELDGDYLCLSEEISLIRYIELVRPQQPLTVEPPLRILGIVASPNDLPKLDVTKEKAQMAAAIEHLVAKGFVTLSWLDDGNWRNLQAMMRKSPWHILHFIGHGGFNLESGEGALSLLNDDGSAYSLTATNLGRLLAGHPSVQLVVLNACEGARASETKLFSSIAAVLTRRGIPAVVSMQYKVTDRAAVEFSRAFYEALAEGIPVEVSVKEARKSICFALRDSFEWGTPVLHLRALESQLFKIDVTGAIFREKVHSPQPAPILVKANVQPDPIPTSGTNAKGLSVLSKKVRQFWVEGVLKQAFQHSALIEFSLDNLPDMVESPWENLPIGAQQAIGDVFDMIGRSLLVLGEPGSGKTTTMLQLAEWLLELDQQQPNLPIPVVFNLSSWTSADKDLADWLVRELSMKYLIPKPIGLEWLQAGRLLLLLDGLDEVGVDHRSACVEAINRFSQEAKLPGIVVCCRFREYIELSTRLTMNWAVRLRALSREKIMAHVLAGGAPHAELYTLLQQDSSFLKLAETPFMLSLMMRTYRDVDTAQLISHELKTIDNRKRELMNAYIKRQFRLAETENSYV